MTNHPEHFDFQPTLSGELIELRPLRPEDFEPLHAVASDPLIWEQHPNPLRYRLDVFRQFFDDALKSGGAFVVVERGTNRYIGSSRYYGLNPRLGEVVIGYTFLGREFWGGRYNRELKRLMLDHAFRFVETALFHVGPENTRSRKAMEKVGAVFVEEGLQTHPDGKRETYLIYRIRSGDLYARAGG